MSFSTDDLNRVFTPEGQQELIERAHEIPPGWEGQSPVAPPGDARTAALFPVAPAAPIADQQPQGQPQGQQPDQYPITDPRFDQVRAMVQGVVQENEQLRSGITQFQQQQQQAEEAAFNARIRGLEEEGTPESYREATRLIQERAGSIVQNVVSTAQAEIARRDQQVHTSLVSGFTQEIITNHPSLNDQEKALLETIPDPDNRVAWADYFEAQHEAQKQLALGQGAAVYAASGAGRVGGQAPAGTTPDGNQPGRRQTSYEIIRETPWETRPG